MRQTIILGTLVVMWALSGAAQAQYYGEEPELRVRGYRDHTGFFSHVSVGAGYSSTQGTARAYDLDWHGIASAYHFALGGSVMERLAVHFSAFGFDSFGATLRVNGKRTPDHTDASTSLTALGAGVTYYLPINLYLSGSVGLAFAAATDSDGGGNGLDPGVAARASVGYEWWVGWYWGLGVALETTYFHANDDTSAGKFAWNGYAITPVFSATSN